MSNALVPTTEAYGALVSAEATAKSLQSFDIPGLELGEQDLPRVKVPSGGQVVWMVPGVDGKPEALEEISGVLISIESRGFLWPREDPGNDLPVLISHDLIRGYKVGDELGDIDPEVLESMKVQEVDEETGETTAEYYDWIATDDGGKNPYANWGSSSKGRGKRCKEGLRLLLLRPGETIPLVINVPAGSLGNFKALRVACARVGCPAWEAEVALSLDCDQNDAGQDYSKIAPRFVQRVDPSLVPGILALRKQFASPDPASRAAAEEALRESRGPVVVDDFEADDNFMEEGDKETPF